MKLWVRSQDKTNLVKVDRLTIDDTNSIFCDYNDFYLGTYKTKERALEVLDEIQNILSGKCILKSYDNVTPEFSENIIINPCEVHIEQLKNYVYNMPEN